MKIFKLKIVALLVIVGLLFSNMGIPVSGAEEVTPDSPDTQTYPTLDGGTHGMYSPDKELTMILYIDPTCAVDRSLLSALGKMNFSPDQVDICCINGRTLDGYKEGMEEMAEKYPDFTMCYYEGGVWTTMTNYMKKYTDASYPSLPFMVFTDKDGVVRYVQSGIYDYPVTKDWVVELMHSLNYGDLIPLSSQETIEAECEVTYGQTNARQMLRRINEFRTGPDAWEWKPGNNVKLVHENLNKLTYDYELEKVAMQRAAELVASYEHDRPNEDTCFTAYSKEYKDSSKGENICIAGGYDFLEEDAFTAWEEADEGYLGQGHRRNMLNSSYSSVGIAHVVYKGYHYWVQEFSSKVVDRTETEANDSPTKVKMSISKRNITSQTILPAESITMNVGEHIPGPQVHLAITTKGTATQVGAPALELLEPLTAKWDFKFTSTSYMQIDDDGNLFATRPVSLDLPATYNGMTVNIPVTAKAAGATPIPSASPESSAAPNPSGSTKPSAAPNPSGSTEPSAAPNPSGSTGPSAAPDPSASTKPSSEPAASAEPGSSSKPASSVRPTASVTNTSKPNATQKPTTTKKPTSTKKPTATSKPSATQKPVVTPGSAAVGSTITDSGSKNVFVVTSAGGAGKMPEVEYKKAADAKKKTVAVPSQIAVDGVKYQVTSIAAKAFKGNKKLTKVKIPNTVTKIGRSAFDGCRALKTVTIGRGVVTIDKNAFRNCKKLTKLTVNSSVIRKVGKNVFKGIPKKAKVKVPRVKRSVYKSLFVKAGLSKNVKLKS